MSNKGVTPGGKLRAKTLFAALNIVSNGVQCSSTTQLLVIGIEP